MAITGKIGNRKYGGRVKGTPNKDTQEAREIAARLKISPFEILLYIAAGDWKSLGYDDGLRIKTVTKDGDEVFEDRISVEARGNAASHAVKYLHPQLKSIDATVGNPDGSPFEPAKPLTPEQMLAMVMAARGGK